MDAASAVSTIVILEADHHPVAMAGQEQLPTPRWDHPRLTSDLAATRPGERCRAGVSRYAYAGAETGLGGGRRHAGW